MHALHEYVSHLGTIYPTIHVIDSYLLKLESDIEHIMSLEIAFSLILGIVTYFLYIFLSARLKPKVAAVVSEIWIYPVKSCKGIRFRSSFIDQRGFLYDRLFAIVDANNKVITQRTHPLMALLSTKIDFDEDNMYLSATGMQDVLAVPLQQCDDAEIISVTVWSDACDAVDIGEDASSWLNECLNSSGLRLVRMADSNVRFTPKDSEDLCGEVGFADSHPFLAVSQASLNKLNAVMLERHRNRANASTFDDAEEGNGLDGMSSPVPKKSAHDDAPVWASMMENFRPNIVLEGCKAFEEDTWCDITFGSTPFELSVLYRLEPCTRCKLPDNNPATGMFDPLASITRALKTFRRADTLGVEGQGIKTGDVSLIYNYYCCHILITLCSLYVQLLFGQRMNHFGAINGKISVGDNVTVRTLKKKA